MRLAATKPSCFFHAPKPPAHPCSSSSGARSRPWPWRASAASDGSAETDDGDENEGLQLESTGARGGARISRRKARLSARRRESIRLEDGVDGGGIGEFLRHPAGVESLLNTRALQSFAPVESEPGTFRCTLQRIGFLGFQVAPVLDLRVTPTGAGCAVEMLSCRFEGSDSVEQQNELFSAFMRNQITWGYDGEEPCLDIDVNLEVTLEVYTKPFSLLPLSAVEKPGNLLMQSLLDRLVPMLGEQLLRDYHSWVQQQQPEDSS